MVAQKIPALSEGQHQSGGRAAYMRRGFQARPAEEGSSHGLASGMSNLGSEPDADSVTIQAG
jgi:hypothetical protein